MAEVIRHGLSYQSRYIWRISLEDKRHVPHSSFTFLPNYEIQEVKKSRMVQKTLINYCRLKEVVDAAHKKSVFETAQIISPEKIGQKNESTTAPDSDLGLETSSARPRIMLQRPRRAIPC